MQKNVSLTTPDDEIVIHRGLFNLRNERESAIGSLKYILSDINDIRTYYFRLGFHLEEFRRYRYYEDFGFFTMEEFCEVNLGMDKSAVSRCINVFLFTCKYGGDYGTVPTMFMDDRYKDFSYSQLCEMVSMDKKLIRQVKPDMTIKQIRELKKGEKSSLSSGDKVATSQPNDYLDMDNYRNLFGAALFNRIKKVERLKPVVLDLYDNNGKLISNYWVDLLGTDSDTIVIRMHDKNISRTGGLVK